MFAFPRVRRCRLQILCHCGATLVLLCLRGTFLLLRLFILRIQRFQGLVGLLCFLHFFRSRLFVSQCRQPVQCDPGILCRLPILHQIVLRLCLVQCRRCPRHLCPHSERIDSEVAQRICSGMHRLDHSQNRRSPHCCPVFVCAKPVSDFWILP